MIHPVFRGFPKINQSTVCLLTEPPSSFAVLGQLKYSRLLFTPEEGATKMKTFSVLWHKHKNTMTHADAVRTAIPLVYSLATLQQKVLLNSHPCGRNAASVLGNSDLVRVIASFTYMTHPECKYKIGKLTHNVMPSLKRIPLLTPP